MSRHPLLDSLGYRPRAAAISGANESRLTHSTRGDCPSVCAFVSSRAIDSAISGLCPRMALMIATRARAAVSWFMSIDPWLVTPLNFPKPPHDASDRPFLTQRDIVFTTHLAKCQQEGQGA